MNFNKDEKKSILNRDSSNFGSINELDPVDDFNIDKLNQIDEWQAAWNVTNAIQGMFFVSLPYVILTGGYWAIASMLIVAYICCYTGKILIDCLYEDGQRVRLTYVDIAKEAWGSKFGAYLVNLAQNIELLMTCILYLVLCGDLFVGSFPDSSMDHTSWTIISCMALLPCAFIQNLKLVSRLSFCNIVVHVIINAIIIIYCFSLIRDWDFSLIDFKINVFSFPISLGIIVFSYTSQIFLPSLEGSMKNKSRFNPMLYLTHASASLLKVFFGLVCFLTWKNETDEVVTNNLPTKELKLFVNLTLIVKALLSYPLPYYASVEFLETTFFESKYSPHHHYFSSCYDSDNYLKLWAVLLRICLILFTLLLAIFIPHFAILMGLIGNITGTMLSLIWPCYFHLKLKWNQLKWYQITADICIIIFGILISITGVYYSSIALANALSNPEMAKDQFYYKSAYKDYGNLTISPLKP